MTDSEILAILLRMLIVISQISLTVTPFRTWYVILVIFTTVFWFWHVKTRIITLSTEKILGPGLGGTHTRTSCKLNWCVLSESCARCPIMIRHCKVFFVFRLRKFSRGTHNFPHNPNTSLKSFLCRGDVGRFSIFPFSCQLGDWSSLCWFFFTWRHQKMKLNKLLIFPKFYNFRAAKN